MVQRTENLSQFVALLDLELVEQHPVGHGDALVLEDDEAGCDHVELALLLALCHELFEAVEGTAPQIVSGLEDLAGWIALGSLRAEQPMLQAEASEKNL